MMMGWALSILALLYLRHLLGVLLLVLCSPAVSLLVHYYEVNQFKNSSWGKNGLKTLI
ncbi:hypothetical protein BDQ94DRAFT_142090 [Aspergillus welwitschiae]|uniref:Uncharacterized protein n=1 Tax=Aspergillus welwitschiae TaxID=1341132 RepID=A0A3F3Q514_9EURO|nr:hypothetical protein BDQ94DRAFT_142090 [Aspergillus welwitschiae]RDH34107.1 hypothetical protein BDQ94DRAFT_142090 [Aspergillus welwitschiae]